MFDGGEVIFANTDPTDTLGAVVTLHASDYGEGATTADFFVADGVNVVTTEAGYANIGLAIDAIHDGASTLEDHADFFLVWYDSGNTVVTLSYVSDAGDDDHTSGGSDAHFQDNVSTTLATFSDVAADAIAASFGNANFAVESLA